MKLTGKCKEEFKKWYRQYIKNQNGRRKLIDGTYYTFFSHFLTDAMQYGVMVDFFDSVGMWIEICKFPSNMQWYYMIDDSAEINDYETRHEARTAAIAKANEIFNKDETK